MQRVYLAAAYRRKPEMQTLAAELTERGYVVSSSWLQEPYDPNMQLKELDDADHQELAERDIDDVISSDIMVFFAEDQNNQPPRGGRHVEFGYALAMGLYIYVCGPERENIFHYLPDIKMVKDTEALLEIL